MIFAPFISSITVDTGSWVLSDQITALQKSDSYLFGSSTMKGAKTGESGNEDGGKSVDTSKMTYSELAAYAAEHPDFKFE